MSCKMALQSFMHCSVKIENPLAVSSSGTPNSPVVEFSCNVTFPSNIPFQSVVVLDDHLSEWVLALYLETIPNAALRLRT